VDYQYERLHRLRFIQVDCLVDEFLFLGIGLYECDIAVAQFA
jgi:hypothetical protein